MIFSMKDIFLFIILPFVIFFIVFILFLFIFSFIFFKYKRKKFLEEYKNEEWLPVVNEEGKIIGKSPRSICHDGNNKFLHPVVHIHIINSKKRLLLQKRAITKDIQPGKWDTSIGGHISFGEKLENAIQREAKEELGIDIDLSKIIPFHKYIFELNIEREYVFSFVYFYDGEITFKKDEIEEVSFFSKNDIKELIAKNFVTENFIKEFSYLQEKEFFSSLLF